MTDKFTGGGLDALTKAAWEEGYKAGAAAEREACAKIAEPKRPRPCDCTDCYCGNFGDAEEVAQWDADMWTANAIRARGEK